MGLSLACIQIYIGAQSPQILRNTTIEAMRKYVIASAFVETTNDNDPDRTVDIGSVENGRWLTLIGTQGNLRELSKYLSTVLNARIVFVNLMDSSVLHLRLYEHGEIVDDYCNAPDRYDL